MAAGSRSVQEDARCPALAHGTAPARSLKPQAVDETTLCMLFVSAAEAGGMVSEQKQQSRSGSGRIHQLLRPDLQPPSEWLEFLQREMGYPGAFRH